VCVAFFAQCLYCVSCVA